MTRQRSSRKIRTQTGGTQQGLSQLHTDMKDLLELQRAQETKFVPEQKDVPRIRFTPNQLHNVELSYQTTQTLSTTAPNFGALAFSLASSSVYGSYTAVFDQYRIVQVNVKIITSGIVMGGGNYIYTVLDYDDSTSPTSVATLLGYASLKITPASVVDERTLSPRLATAAYSGSTFSGYANMPPSTWIDSASPGVQYYGLKYYSPPAAGNAVITFIITMMVQFKAQRAS